MDYQQYYEPPLYQPQFFSTSTSKYVMRPVSSALLSTNVSDIISSINSKCKEQKLFEMKFAARLVREFFSKEERKIVT